MISFPVTDKKQGENLLISEQFHNFADGRKKTMASVIRHNWVRKARESRITP